MEQTQKIIDDAKLFPKGDYYSYIRLTGRLQMLELTQAEYDKAVRKIAKVLEI